jgi:hypothetical protein
LIKNTTLHLNKNKVRKHKAPRNQDPEEGWKSEKGLEEMARDIIILTTF